MLREIVLVSAFSPHHDFFLGGAFERVSRGGERTANVLFALANYKAGEKKGGGGGFGGQRKFVTAPLPPALIE